MDNQLTKEYTQIEPEWGHPVIPGNATQGCILFTNSEMLKPPQSSTHMSWIPMEDIIGVASVKLEYDVEEDVYKLYKAKGHLDGNNHWTYEWELVGSFSGLSEDARQSLEDLVYVEYQFDTTSQAGHLIIKGKDKGGVWHTLCNVEISGGEPVDAYTKAETDALLDEKQDTLTEGDGIKIENNEIKVKYWLGTQAEYDALQTKDPSTLYLIHE